MTAPHETTARRNAHAVRIHGMLRKTEGKISVREISRRLNIYPQMVRLVIEEHGWTTQSFRAVKIRQENEKTLTRDVAPGVREVDLAFK